MCKRLDWNIEFLSGGYESFTTQEIKEIATTIKDITGDGVWLNTGITDELDEYGLQRLSSSLWLAYSLSKHHLSKREVLNSNKKHQSYSS